MNRIAKILLAGLLLATGLTGCASKEPEPRKTVFPDNAFQEIPEGYFDAAEEFTAAVEGNPVGQQDCVNQRGIDPERVRRERKDEQLWIWDCGLSWRILFGRSSCPG